MSSTQIAKATLLRLAQSRQEPTPENYAKAWVEAGGMVARSPDAEGEAWAHLVDQLAKGLDRNSRQWTAARKKDSLQRVLDGSRSHPQRLRERLAQLVATWQQDTPDSVAGALDEAPSPPTVAQNGVAWPSIAGSLSGALRAGLTADPHDGAAVARSLSSVSARWQSQGAGDTLAAEVAQTCGEAKRVFAQRHHLVDELGKLVRALTEGLTELCEDESWARGQADALRHRFDESEGLSVRGVRSAADLLTRTRVQQQRLRGERDRARAALRALVESLAAELETLGGQTGRFGDELARRTDDLERADSREQMSAVLHQMLAASRSVQTEVADAGQRIAAGRAQAETLNARVRELEGELKRLSEEVSTDALTQVANRRGLAQAFELETARAARDGQSLAVGLIDLDNFKKLNDSLGHAAGDEALKALAARVRDALRPSDQLARFGGEEFVVLLPATAEGEAQEALTRLQRDLTASLFMHEGREVFVTFSAGVTAWRAGESLDAAIERADAALYEAKRSGKNRTCVA